MDDVTMLKAAKAIAKDEHLNNFSSRRGIGPYDLGAGTVVLYLYNNNPWPDGRRDQETAAFRDWLRSEGIAELAYATYPTQGPDKDYSYAMIIDASASREVEVARKLRELILVNR